MVTYEITIPTNEPSGRPLTKKSYFWATTQDKLIC